MEGIMISDKQREDWQALVDYLRGFENGACINVLVEDGPDNTTDFAGLLSTLKERDALLETVTLEEDPK
jgi:hypothetical protein